MRGSHRIAVSCLVLCSAAFTHPAWARDVTVVLEADDPGAALMLQTPAPRGLDQGGLNGNVGLIMASSPLCAAPCAARVPAGSTLAVGGRGLRQSRPFVVSGDNATVRVGAEVGTENALVGGIILGAGGGLVGLVGLAMLPIAFFVDSTSLKIASAVMIPAGIAGVVGGITMAAGSETKIRVEPGAPGGPTTRRRTARLQVSPFGLRVTF